MTRSLLHRLRTKTDYKLIDVTLLDPTTKKIISFLKNNKEDFIIRLESHARLIDSNLLLNGSASTSTGTEKLALVRQYNATRSATFHIYRNERKDLILTRQVAELVRIKQTLDKEPTSLW